MEKKRFNARPRRVALFVTCMVDMIYPGVGIAATELLEKSGVEVIFPEAQTCCGQPAFNAGYRDEARTLGRRFLDIFGPLLEDGTIDAVVAPSGSCVTMTSHFYAEIFAESHEAHQRERAERLGAATFELTEFLVDVLGVEETRARYAGDITYHPCCHLLRELHIDAQPRLLLNSLEEAHVIELPDGEDCCGFGGLFAIKNSEISGAMGRRKALNLQKSGAGVVAMCDVSCMTHINGILRRQGIDCRAVHVAELLNGQVTPAVDSDAQTEPTSPDHPRRWQEG